MNEVNEAGIVTAVLALIALIAWFVRLEAKGTTNSRDIEKLEKRQNYHEDQMSALDLRMMDKLSRIEQMVAKIEGTLDRDRAH